MFEFWQHSSFSKSRKQVRYRKYPCLAVSPPPPPVGKVGVKVDVNKYFDQSELTI